MDTNQPLQHLAIIPDGNRRWAKKQALPTPRMYDEGGNKLSQITEAAFNEDVVNVTLWVGSRSNLQARSKVQVQVLEDLYIKKFNELAEDSLVHEKQIKIVVLGEWQDLVRNEVNLAIERAMSRTAHYSSGRQLTVLVGYDGRRERGAAVQALLNDRPSDVPSDPAAADQLLRKYSWTGQLPDVDLVIRTGAWQDPHNSAGFLSLLTNESQYAYPPVLWPDFTPNMLHEVLEDFAARERRMGK
jgi:undecaprenyl diphosphate synthase